MKVIVTLATAGLMGFSHTAHAQTPLRIEAVAGVERVDYRYRFHNDSRFDTAGLVPHFFEQRYERTGPLFGARGLYTVLSRAMTTAVTVSAEREGFGSDFDTFLQPDGDRVVSGTAGGVSLGSFRIEHTVGLIRREAFRAAMVFGWRRDRADFHPADRIVTHTQPPSETREFTTDRERTVSQTFEVGVEGVVGAPIGGGWKVEASARLVPALRARLLTQLPDKYPGRDIVFSAAGWSGSGRIDVMRAAGQMDVGAWISIEQAGSYRKTAEFDRTAAAIGLLIAFESRR
jgi:hypothetical protein